jgi:hypothetical protein
MRPGGVATPTSPMRRARAGEDPSMDANNLATQLRAYINVLESQNATLQQQNEHLRTTCRGLRGEVDGAVARQRQEKDSHAAHVQSLLAAKRSLEMKMNQDRAALQREVLALKAEVESLTFHAELRDGQERMRVANEVKNLRHNIREITAMCPDTSILSYHTAEGPMDETVIGTVEEEEDEVAEVSPDIFGESGKPPADLRSFMSEAYSSVDSASRLVCTSCVGVAKIFPCSDPSTAPLCPTQYDYAEEAAAEMGSMFSDSSEEESLLCATEEPLVEINLMHSLREDPLSNLPESLIASENAPEWLDYLIAFAQKLEDSERERARLAAQLVTQARSSSGVTSKLSKDVRHLAAKLERTRPSMMKPVTDIEEIPTVRGAAILWLEQRRGTGLATLVS